MIKTHAVIPARDIHRLGLAAAKLTVAGEKPPQTVLIRTAVKSWLDGLLGPDTEATATESTDLDKLLEQASQLEGAPPA